MDPCGRVRRGSSSRIPRARGDGPGLAPGALVPVTDSPRSRGWTEAVHVAPGPSSGFPALAGMDPRTPGAGRRARRIPRARGDGPMVRRCPSTAGVDSPRSRGWTGGQSASHHPPFGFPALAGMDPGASRRRPCSCRIPRARGDGPRRRMGRTCRGRDSPRSRGWTRRERVAVRVRQGFPALAGMDLERADSARSVLRIPRARGDGPGCRPLRRLAPADSPRSRGWTVSRRTWDATQEGFPALAGMDPHPASAPAGW